MIDSIFSPVRVRIYQTDQVMSMPILAPSPNNQDIIIERIKRIQEGKRYE